MKGSQTILTPPQGSTDSATRKGATIAKPDGPKVFNFDRSYWSFDRGDPHYAGQDDLFKDLGGPLLDNAFQGYNNCIFAYGQTGSGKSYSMVSAILSKHDRPKAGLSQQVEQHGARGVSWCV